MENKYTLHDICTEIYKLEPFDELNVMYRTNMPKDFEEEDTLFGYCTVINKMSGFAIRSEDGDDYNMSDIFYKFDYKPNYFDGLVVWFESNYYTGENK